MTSLVRILLLALLLAAPLAQAGKPGGGGSTNVPPRVALTWPGAGMTLPAGSALVLKAEATDIDGSIAHVDFYRGATLIASIAAPPYEFAWPAVAAGTYSLSAKATDNAGAVTASTAVTLTVGPPGIAITSPANGAVLLTDTLTVSGTYTGTTDSTILVDNGSTTRRATLNGNSFSAVLPLTPGSNTLGASIARTDQTSALTAVTVTRALPPLVAITAPAISTFDAPANVVITVDALSPGGSIAKVDFYRSGNLLATRTTPPYSFTWSNLGKGLYTVSAQATDNHGQTGAAGLTLTVNGPNAPPTATLTAPAGGTIYSAPATITLAATAADSDGTIAQVAFYQNGTLLNATNVSPYTFAWSDVPAGSYTLTAQATDDRDGSTTSAPVTVTVAPPSAPPTVTLTAPTSGASYATGATIPLAASASDPDGAVAKVDFYQGGTLIGSSTQAPYTAPWTTLQAGSYTLTATATDDTGVSATSAPVTVTVVKSTITYFHDDLLGSPIAATDEDGNVLWKESYKPYGERVANNPAAAGERQWYTGKPQDKETGLAYYGARYYDPAIGRFMGVDAADFNPANLHSFNRYAYGNNNPYRFVDPNGMWAEDVFLAIPGIILGAHSLGQNLKEGNVSAAAVDVGGLISDTIAAALPGVPGGAGLAIAATRNAAKGVEAAAAKGAAPAFQDFNQARNAALQWLEARGFKAEQATLGKFGDNAGKPIGMKSADGSVGFRVEHDGRNGAHINVWAGKEKGPHYTFEGDQSTVNQIVKQFGAE